MGLLSFIGKVTKAIAPKVIKTIKGLKGSAGKVLKGIKGGALKVMKEIKAGMRGILNKMGVKMTGQSRGNVGKEVVRGTPRIPKGVKKQTVGGSKTRKKLSGADLEMMEI